MTQKLERKKKKKKLRSHFKLFILVTLKISNTKSPQAKIPSTNFYETWRNFVAAILTHSSEKRFEH